MAFDCDACCAKQSILPPNTCKSPNPAICRAFRADLMHRSCSPVQVLGPVGTCSAKSVCVCVSYCSSVFSNWLSHITLVFIVCKTFSIVSSYCVKGTAVTNLWRKLHLCSQPGGVHLTLFPQQQACYQRGNLRSEVGPIIMKNVFAASVSIG